MGQMRFKTPCNPDTGKPAIGTLEEVRAVGLFNGDPSKGPVDYEGTTKVLWDTQKTVESDGMVWLVDEDGGEWPSEAEGQEEAKHG